MAFMRPEYLNESFHSALDRSRETAVCPADVYGTLERFESEIGTRDEDRDQSETIEGKWWVRLSAPGYMDATEWDGPYDSLEAARKGISDAYDCDPDSGNNLDDDTSDDD